MQRTAERISGLAKCLWQCLMTIRSGGGGVSLDFRLKFIKEERIAYCLDFRIFGKICLLCKEAEQATIEDANR
jgi:hypothetical protein